MLVFAIYELNQICAYIYPHSLELPSHTPIPPLLVIMEHRAKLPMLQRSFSLAIYSTYSSGHVWMDLEPAIQGKSEREKQISYINACMWNLEKWYQ